MQGASKRRKQRTGRRRAKGGADGGPPGRKSETKIVLQDPEVRGRRGFNCQIVDGRAKPSVGATGTRGGEKHRSFKLGDCRRAHRRSLLVSTQYDRFELARFFVLILSFSALCFSLSFLFSFPLAISHEKLKT